MSKTKAKRPYWLWDYDLTETDVRRILAGKNEVERRWLMGRILTSAHFRDIWQYLKPKQILAEWANLRLRPDVKNNWQRAFKVWGYDLPAGQ